MVKVNDKKEKGKKGKEEQEGDQEQVESLQELLGMPPKTKPLVQRALLIYHFNQTIRWMRWW